MQACREKFLLSNTCFTISPQGIKFDDVGTVLSIVDLFRSIQDYLAKISEKLLIWQIVPVCLGTS